MSIAAPATLSPLGPWASVVRGDVETTNSSVASGNAPAGIRTDRSPDSDTASASRSNLASIKTASICTGGGAGGSGSVASGVPVAIGSGVAVPTGTGAAVASGVAVLDSTITVDDSTGGLAVGVAAGTGAGNGVAAGVAVGGTGTGDGAAVGVGAGPTVGIAVGGGTGVTVATGAGVRLNSGVATVVAVCIGDGLAVGVADGATIPTGGSRTVMVADSSSNAPSSSVTRTMTVKTVRVFTVLEKITSLPLASKNPSPFKSHRKINVSETPGSVADAEIGLFVPEITRPGRLKGLKTGEAFKIDTVVLPVETAPSTGSVTRNVISRSSGPSSPAAENVVLCPDLSNEHLLSRSHANTNPLPSGVPVTLPATPTEPPSVAL